MSLPTPRARRRTPLVLVLLALLVATVAGCTSQQPQERVAGDHTLRVDGRERSYLLRPATGLGKGEKAAVVMVLHQEGGTPEGVAEETELASLSEQGATLVYPAGVDTSWDAGGCCGLPSRQGIDDVKFLETVLQDVEERTPVDLQRAALVGYSSGGMLTYNFVCEKPGTLAAAVVVSGSLESPCKKDITVPDVLTLHGKQDGTIGLEKSSFVRALGLTPKPVNGTLREITASADCDDTPVLTNESDADVYRWSGCNGGGLVEARLIAGAGHGWGTLGASERTADFLRAQLLQG
ncbi:MAG: hypothetical protein JWO60_1976 [Frankiales bacterium]|nr:hypothetical protein [Frankiales bacterium]